MTSHVILVGLPGSGKSTVGPLVARHLGWDFLDIDEEIVRRLGRTVREIFEDEGEPFFRQLETQLVNETLDRSEPWVLAPGGGWAATGQNMQRGLDRATVVYLETTPSVAARRVGSGADRPILQPEPNRRMAELLATRDPYYAQASLIMNTDNSSPADLALHIAELARTGRG